MEQYEKLHVKDMLEAKMLKCFLDSSTPSVGEIQASQGKGRSYNLAGWIKKSKRAASGPRTLVCPRLV